MILWAIISEASLANNTAGGAGEGPLYILTDAFVFLVNCTVVCFDVIQQLSVWGFDWFMYLDFQIKIILILIVCLLSNLGLIYVAWRIYGDNLTEKFINPGLNEASQVKSPEEQHLHRD